MDAAVKGGRHPASSYNSDPYTWALAQARALRERRPAELDWDNLAEEVEDLARRDARALQGNYEVLIAHLLKLTHARGTVRQRNQRLWFLHLRNARRFEPPALRTSHDTDKVRNGRRTKNMYIRSSCGPAESV